MAMKQSVCRKCNRMIFISKMDDGSVLEMDCEIILVVLFEGTPPERVRARRIHGEMCMVYQTQTAKLRAKGHKG